MANGFSTFPYFNPLQKQSCLHYVHDAYSKHKIYLRVETEQAPLSGARRTRLLILSGLVWSLRLWISKKTKSRTGPIIAAFIGSEHSFMMVDLFKAFVQHLEVLAAVTTTWPCPLVWTCFFRLNEAPMMFPHIFRWQISWLEHSKQQSAAIFSWHG